MPHSVAYGPAIPIPSEALQEEFSFRSVVLHFLLLFSFSIRSCSDYGRCGINNPTNPEKGRAFGMGSAADCLLKAPADFDVFTLSDARYI